MNPLEFDAPPRRALVVSLRYLGDALLVTPVVSAMKRTWPACEIDVMTFAPAATILAGNAAVSRVVTVQERPSRGELLRTLVGLWRRYDLAVVAQPGTRPFLYGRVAGRRCVAFVPATAAKSWWKRPLLSRAVPFASGEPTVLENLRLAEVAGAKAADAEVVAPTAGLDLSALLARIGRPLAPFKYVVIHPSPRTIPKRWTRDGWRALIAHFFARGYDVVVSGGPGAEEARYLSSLLDGIDAVHLHNVQGRLSLAELADLIRHARLFVGVDTATTHIAAATGTPTVAIFGPTDPVIWGPWGGARYERVAYVQRRGSISLIQNPALACVPCQQEGCDRHQASRSECLDTLAPARVIEEVEQVLSVERGSGVA
jgi:heptosyltransferase III